MTRKAPRLGRAVRAALALALTIVAGACIVLAHWKATDQNRAGVIFYTVMALISDASLVWLLLGRRRRPVTDGQEPESEQGKEGCECCR